MFNNTKQALSIEVPKPGGTWTCHMAQYKFVFVSIFHPYICILYQPPSVTYHCASKCSFFCYTSFPYFEISWIGYCISAVKAWLNLSCSFFILWFSLVNLITTCWIVLDCEMHICCHYIRLLVPQYCLHCYLHSPLLFCFTVFSQSMLTTFISIVWLDFCIFLCCFYHSAPQCSLCHYFWLLQEQNCVTDIFLSVSWIYLWGAVVTLG